MSADLVNFRDPGIGVPNYTSWNGNLNGQVHPVGNPIYITLQPTVLPGVPPPTYSESFGCGIDPLQPLPTVGENLLIAIPQLAIAVNFIVSNDGQSRSIPVPATHTELINRLAFLLRTDTVLGQYFKVTTLGSGVGLTIQGFAKVPGAKFNLTVTNNLTPSITFLASNSGANYSAADTVRDYRNWFQVVIQKDYTGLFQTGGDLTFPEKLIVSDIIEVGHDQKSNHNAVDISGIIKPYLKTTAPVQYEGNLSADLYKLMRPCFDSSVNFYVTYGEAFLELPSLKPFNYTLGQYGEIYTSGCSPVTNAVVGGIRSNFYPILPGDAFCEFWNRDKGSTVGCPINHQWVETVKFLTNRNRQTLVPIDQPNWLYFWFYSSEFDYANLDSRLPIALRLRVTFYYKDTTVSTPAFVSIQTPPHNGQWMVDIKALTLFSLLSPADQPDIFAMDVQVFAEFTGGDFKPVTEVFNVKLDRSRDTFADQHTHLVFENTLGGYDSFTFYGFDQKTIEVESTNASRNPKWVSNQQYIGLGSPAYPQIESPHPVLPTQRSLSSTDYAILPENQLIRNDIHPGLMNDGPAMITEARRKFTLTSQVLSKADYEWLEKELITSPNVYMSNVTDPLGYGDRLGSKMVNIQIKNRNASYNFQTETGTITLECMEGLTVQTS